MFSLVIALMALVLPGTLLSAPIPRDGQVQVDKRWGYGAFLDGNPLPPGQRVAFAQMERQFLRQVRHGNVLAPRPQYPNLPSYSGALFGQ